MLSFEGVERRFGRARVLARLSFSVRDGERVALLGPNGAGKTTVLKLAATLLKPTAGAIQLAGADTRAPQALRRRIGYVGHAPLLYEELTARQNLDFFARLYGVGKPGGRVADWLDRVGLAGKADEPVDALSRGMQQRLAVARALIHEPSFLFLDEPFAGLDAEGTAKVADLLESWCASPGRFLLFATHDPGQVARLATRALVLHHGRVSADLPRSAAWGTQELHRVYALATAGGA